MTLHNAKGLEYPTVFVAGCEDGVFPHQRALDEGGVEEERRLFYVAVTRAMRELYLTYARRRARVRRPHLWHLPSRFLDEIPAELCEREDLPAPRPGGAAWHGLQRHSPPAPAPCWPHRWWWRRRPAAAGSGRGGGWSSGSHASTSPSASYRLGEDVVHAAFGDGVVTGVEPGGIIVVRFAGDGRPSES